MIEQNAEKPELSIIVPVFNEEENLPELYRRLSEIINNAEYVKSGEILFVNDGSVDRSVEIITDLHKKDQKVKLVNLSRNFGHQAAFSAGIDYSQGNAVILMDADLQDPPEVLLQMLDMWRNDDADVVYAIRQKRKETAWKKASYFMFYRLLQFMSNIDIPLDSGDFCLMDRKVVDKLKEMPERNRFLRGMRSWVGFKQVAMPYERHSRYAGEAKYTLSKLLGLGLNGIFSFSVFPLRLATYLGLITVFLGILYLIFVTAYYFIARVSPQGWTSLIAIVLLIGGVQMIILGTIGEYIARIYEETKQRPNYIVKEFLDKNGQ